MDRDKQALQTLLDRQEIEALNTVFARTLDGGDVEEFLGIFTADVDYSSGFRKLVGLEPLREFFQNRAASGRVSRHLLCGQDIRFVDADRAQASSYWMVFAGNGALPVNHCTPFQVADVEDKLIRTAEGWKIAKRVISSVFRNADFVPGQAK